MSSVNNFWSNSYSNDYSYLFGNVSSNSKNSASSNLLGIDLAEYSSITRGSYSKLVKAYYQKAEKTSSDNSVSSEDKVTQTTMKGNAKELYDAVDALVTSGKDSLFKKIDVKDEETGDTSKGYDTDKIYKAVNSFVEAYNSMVKSSTDSSDNAVLRQTLHMVNSVSANGSLLGEIGIKVGADNQLSIDEEAFKNADMNTVKTLFSGNNSLGGKIQSAASNIYVRNANALSESGTYTVSGTMNRLSTSSMLDSFL